MGGSGAFSRTQTPPWNNIAVAKGSEGSFQLEAMRRSLGGASRSKVPLSGVLGFLGFLTHFVEDRKLQFFYASKDLAADATESFHIYFKDSAHEFSFIFPVLVSGQRRYRPCLGLSWVGSVSAAPPLVDAVKTPRPQRGIPGWNSFLW